MTDKRKRERLTADTAVRRVITTGAVRMVRTATTGQREYLQVVSAVVHSDTAAG